ncbi:MAG TPA: radical SAM protein [Thermoplasmatales archaeon]|nr:radical SAM protein [Thermoplasmatales archaeon]HEX17433.1 radical SAM protein [Thermoplasmatales archaeon]
MKVCEIFYSIQGEGELAGYPTIFIRLTGCNLRCRYCDTEYAFYEGKEMGIDDIIERIKGYRSRYVCVTGGEPLLQREVLDLMETLLEDGYIVSLETNGSISLEDVCMRLGKYGDSFIISMDIKCPSSGMSERMRLENIDLLRENDQLKFVVLDEDDYNYAKDIISRYRPRCKIIIQPVWGTDVRKIAELMLKDGLQARLSLQIHKIIWGDRRGI